MLVNTAMHLTLVKAKAHHPALRHITAPHRTTVKLEGEFWQAIDHLADKTGRNWSEWVATELVGKPVGIGAASWLRVRCLIHSTQGA